MALTLTVNPDGTVSYDPLVRRQSGATAGTHSDGLVQVHNDILTGQTTTANVTVTIAERNLVDLVGGERRSALEMTVDNSLSVTSDGTNVTITDSASVFSLTQAVIDAGFSGGGSNSITGPLSAFSRLVADMGDGNDTVTAANAGIAALTFKSSANLAIAETVTNSGTTTIISPNITSTASGLIVAPTVNLTGSNSIGTSGQNVVTKADVLKVTVADGAGFVTETDGADVTATATGNGSIAIANLSGTLRIAGASSASSGNISLTSAGPIAIDASLSAGNGAVTASADSLSTSAQVSTSGGTISLSSANAMSIGANVISVTGTISLTANTDAVGSEEALANGGFHHNWQHDAICRQFYCQH